MAQDKKQKWVDDNLGKMNLKQKIGQLMVFSFAGPVITPDIVDLIKNWDLGGLRINLKFRTTNLLNDVKPGSTPHQNIMRSWVGPTGINRDYSGYNQCTSCTPFEYATTLNKLKEIALERPSGIPIHCAYDQEGNGADDLLCGVKLFPSPMGLAASGDSKLAYEVALASGKQAKALGANMIHSPVVDVNTNPKNPEIGPRSYGESTDMVEEFSLQSMKGYLDAGIMPTGKHFPGRGESESDAHWGLPVVKLTREQLIENHIRPYKKLFDEGLPCIMSAHTVFPELGDDQFPATLSPAIMNELLRKELGFEGVVTTDNMMMGGILMQYEMTEGIILALKAGCDLILCRDESPARWKILQSVEQAVKKGELSESRVDESVARILKLRWDMGLAEGGGIVDPSVADKVIHDPEISKIESRASRESIVLMRNEASLIPLPKDQNFLLIEQMFPTQVMSNNMYSHPGLLWEAISNINPKCGCVQIPADPADHDIERVYARLNESEIIVATNYYYHKTPGTMTEVYRKIRSMGKKIILISNNPYEKASPADFQNVINCFNPGSPEAMKIVAEILFGKIKATATLPVKL